MATLHHPTLDHKIDVPDSQVEAWVEQGWRKSQPKAVADKTDEKKGA